MPKRVDSETILNIIFVLFAFTLPLSRASAPIATAMILLVFIFSPLQRKRVAQIWSMPAAKWITLFVAYYFLSLLITASPDYSTEQWKEGLRYLLPYLYLLPAGIMGLLISRKFLPIVLLSFFAGMLVSEFLSYLIYFDIWQKKRFLVSKMNPTPFMHHIQYSTFLALTALIVLERIIREKKIWQRVVWVPFFAILISTLFLINGRTGQAAFLLGLFVLAFAQFKNKIKALAISLLLTAVVIGGAYSFSETFRGRIAVAKSDVVNLIEKNDYQTSLGYRIGVMVLSVPLIEEHPIVGTGVIDTMKLIRDGACECFANDYWLKRANHMQNQYLQVLVETGVIGLALLLMIFYSIAKMPLRSQEYRNIKLIFLTVYLFTMFSDIQLHIQFTAGLFTLMTGLLLAKSRIEKEDTEQKATANG